MMYSRTDICLVLLSNTEYDGLNMVTNVYGCLMSYSTMTLNLIQVRRRGDQNVLRVIWRYEETRRPLRAATVLLASMRNAQVYQRTFSIISTTPSIHGSAWPVVYHLSRTHSLILRFHRLMIQLRTILWLWITTKTLIFGKCWANTQPNIVSLEAIT